MQNTWSQPRRDQLRQTVSQALKTMLLRPEYLSYPGEMLRQLEEQVSLVLTEAPIREDVGSTLAIRAELAAVIHTEIARLTARVS
ncbi:hypothetical protein [Muricoccus vinaceus]|uniref:Uncharacterized protein n=1 Tax=Muricoccus vinaceus TaxID=424704 RepID=A0ABV6J190_9PROT